MPSISSVSPPSVIAGTGDTAVTVNGNGFVTTSVTALDGTPLVTTFVSSSVLKATIPASMIPLGQVHLVTVTNPAPGGGTSANAGPWISTGSMTASRAVHTQTLLQNGKVLIAGGGYFQGFISSVLATAEIFDPGSRTSTATGSMTTPRAYQTATLLANGKVLIAGGTFGSVNGSPSGGALASAELYDPVAGTYTATGNMTVARMYPTATLLNDGTVLIVGGVTASGNALATAEVYNPATGTFSATGNMSTQRWLHTATLLQNGKVLIAGGPSSSLVDLDTAEIYDPISRTFSATGSLAMGRESGVAQLLNNGSVLIAGGYQQPLGVLAESELYNPSTGTFAATGSMGTSRNLSSAVLLGSGRVLVVGGVDGSSVQQSAELYDPLTGTFAPTWMMIAARATAAATALSDGSVLVTGGMGNQSGYNLLASAEIYPPPSAATSTSALAEFTVRNPLPVITNLSYSTAAADTQVTVTGTGFNANSEILLNGKSVVADGNPGTTTQAWFYPGYAGSYSVAVSNPTPGGGMSNTASLTVTVGVQVLPSLAIWNLGSTNQFTGVVTGSSNTGVNWKVHEGSSGGSVTSSGLYTAPMTTGIFHVVGTSVADPTQSAVSTVQIGPGAGQMLTTGPMTTSRGYDAAAMLANGKVLFVGGRAIGSSGSLNSSELYDPNSGGFTATGNMQANRAHFTATLLANGTVLVAGGDNYTGGSLITLNTAEIYNPATGSFTSTGNMIGPSSFHSATLLGSGEVLIVGGGANPQLYNPATGMFSATGAMVTPRGGCMTAMLSSGKVLFTGGYDNGGNILASAELYDPIQGTFATTGNMTVPRVSAYPFYNEAVLLGNGKVLVVGGITSDESAELYDPTTGTFTQTGTAPAYPLYGFPLVLLRNGTVFIPAGTTLNGSALNPTLQSGIRLTEIYDPGTDKFFATPQTVDIQSELTTATVLANGSVLIAGGGLSGQAADIYIPPTSDPTGANPFLRQSELPLNSHFDQSSPQVHSGLASPR